MKKIYLVTLLAAVIFSSNAQDEGTIVKKERLALSKGIFIGGGPSFTLGKNIGDYSTGLNFEGGFVKRLNRVLSLGGSLSYTKFKYDPKKTGLNSGFIGIVDDGSGDYHYELYTIELEGGDISMMALALNIKVNFIPVTDNSKFSIYGFAKPFVTQAKRDEVHGSSDYYTNYYDPEVLEDWYLEVENSPWGPDTYDALKSESKVTGGIVLGPGVEIMPAGKFSFFVQAAISYTLPVSYVSTESYEPTVQDYLKDEFPMAEEGFPSINIQFGATFNF
jgi:hypothetical protein